jgi:cation transporter-like permease
MTAPVVFRVFVVRIAALGGGMDEDLETRVAAQFSSLYLTLVSVLVGLVLADLFGQVHARMVLWPLTPETWRTWFQIIGNTLVALSAWITYSHLGVLRRRLPTIWDTLDAALVLVTVPLNATTGRHEAWGYFFWASAYSLLALCAVHINLWQATREPALAHLPRIVRFGGPYTFLYFGVPAYLAIAAASFFHLAPLWLEVFAASWGPGAGVLVSVLFLREWRAAVQFKPPS